ncbi:hypothetical protein RAMDARK_0742 [Rickettsia amblyommatis str. Darkwater]|nr:hypothetical protein RAMDARK_0742 [Rickettsia amblyommatis str. Darkwater]
MYCFMRLPRRGFASPRNDVSPPQTLAVTDNNQINTDKLT